MKREELATRSIETADLILREHDTISASKYVSSIDHHGVGAVLFSNEAGRTVKPGGVSSHIFAFRCSGARTERTDKRKSFKGRVGTQGMTVFVSADEECRWESEGAHTVLNFFLSTDYLSKLSDEVFRGNECTLTFHEASFRYDQEGAQLGRLVEERLKSSVELCGLEIDALAQMIGILALRRYSAVAGRAPPERAGRLSGGVLERIVEYIHENLAFQIRLSDLACTAGMSKFAFARAFRNATGIPPHKYLIRVRLERAQELLGLEELTVGQIAHEVGFADQSQFTSHFRAAFGTTPARYRAAKIN